MHYAVHGHTAAELIVERANAEMEHMGLTTWENAPNGKIVKPDVSIAKNYLKQVELEDMGRLVNAVLDMAERMAKRHIPMTMEDWAKRIDIILEAGGDAILPDAGKVSAEYAKEFAESEFEKYRVIQDRLFQSDFDKFNGELPFDDSGKGWLQLIKYRPTLSIKPKVGRIALFPECQSKHNREGNESVGITGDAEPHDVCPKFARNPHALIAAQLIAHIIGSANLRQVAGN